MPDIGSDIVAIVSASPMANFVLGTPKSIILQLDEEFRYLQKKKNVVKEFLETRLKVHPVVLFSS